jgi:AcrR family transcriptional regulator
MTAIQIKNQLDPRVKRTRKLLHDAFDSLLAEKGFESITVQDIAERATVNRATFYAHYQDKYHLAEGRTRELFQERLASRLPDRSDVSARAFETLCQAVFDFLADLYGHCKMDRQLGSLLEVAMHETLNSFIADLLGRAARSAQAKRRIDATALVMTSAIIGVAVQWNRTGRHQPSAELSRQVVGTLIHGVFDTPSSPAA